MCASLSRPKDFRIINLSLLVQYHVMVPRVALFLRMSEILKVVCPHDFWHPGLGRSSKIRKLRRVLKVEVVSSVPEGLGRSWSLQITFSPCRDTRMLSVHRSNFHKHKHKRYHMEHHLLIARGGSTQFLDQRNFLLCNFYGLAAIAQLARAIPVDGFGSGYMNSSWIFQFPSGFVV